MFFTTVGILTEDKVIDILKKSLNKELKSLDLEINNEQKFYERVLKYKFSTKEEIKRALKVVNRMKFIRKEKVKLINMLETTYQFYKKVNGYVY